MTSASVTRRFVMGGLASFTAAPAAAFSVDGTHFGIADGVRKEMRGRGGALRLLVPQGSEANVLPVAEAFSNLTGVDVDVEIAAVRAVATTLLLAHLEGKTRHDVALPATFDVPDLVAAGVLRPLVSPSEPHSGQMAYYTEGDSFDGVTYGYQTDGDAYLMFLNRDFVDDEGLALAYEDAFGHSFVAPASWDEFDRQTAFVSQNRPTAFGALLPRHAGYVEWEFWLRLHAKGIWPLSPEFEPQFAGDEGIAALEEMIAIKPYLAPDHGGQSGLFKNWVQYRSAPTYLTLGWGGTQKFLGSAGRPMSGRLAFAPLPGGNGSELPGRLPYFNWGWSYAVMSNGPEPDLAHAFARFAVSPTMSTKAVRQRDGFFDPFRPEHYNDSGIREIYGEDFLEVHRQSLTSAIPDFYVANRSAYLSTLGSWLVLALDGVVSPQVALDRVASHWRLLSDGVAHEQQARRWRQLRAKYPSNVARHLRDLTF